MSGLVLLSDASNGMPVAVLEAGAVTALRTGAAAVLAAEVLGRPDADRVGDRRRRERPGGGTDVRRPRPRRGGLGRGRWRAERTAEEVGGRVARSRDEALGADLVVTVTPGHAVVFGPGACARTARDLMGADGPGKAEIAVEELARVRSSATTGSRRATTATSRTRSRPVRSPRTTRPSSATCSPDGSQAVVRTTSRSSTRPGWRFRTSRSRWR